MRADKHPRRGAPHRVAGALLTTGLLTAALLATVLLAMSASAPAALTLVTALPVSPTANPVPTGPHRVTAATPGWHVIKAIGPYNQDVSGTLTARSARDAWSVWTGTGFTAVERLTGTGWTRVPLPARFGPYVRSAVAFDGDPAGGFWLFSSYRPAAALRFTGTRWTLAPIPSWVLREQPGGRRSAVTATFSPGDVWVFSLGAGAYAAHYNGHAWAKVKLPGAPDDVSAVTAVDIWALAGRVAMHWNGRSWGTSRIPAATGKPAEGFARLSATGPKSAWVVRTRPAPGPAPEADVLHWNGTRWQRVAGAPAAFVGDVVPDGAGGLWATGLNLNPSGFWLFFHLTAGHWTTVTPPAGVFSQAGKEHLTWVPGTRSLWGAAVGLSSAGNYGLLIKYGP